MGRDVMWEAVGWSVLYRERNERDAPAHLASPALLSSSAFSRAVIAWRAIIPSIHSDIVAMALRQQVQLLRLPSSIRTIAASHAFRPEVASSAAPFRCLGDLSRRSYATAHTAPESSVNHTEVSHFNTLASSWWDPHGSSRLLHLMNPLRHDFLRRCLAPSPPGSGQKLRYLDVGCGGGIFAESAARLANTDSVTGIDPTPEVIAVAKRHQRTDPLLQEPHRLTYLNTAIEDLETPSDNLYDIVSLFEVVEHIQRPNAFLDDCLSHLKPGGWLVGSTIARTPVSWFTTKFMAEDVLRIVPRGTHDWNQYIQPQERCAIGLKCTSS